MRRCGTSTTWRLGLRIVLVVALLKCDPSFAQPMSLVIGVDGLGYGDRGLSVSDNTPNIDALFDGSWAEGYFGSYSDQAFAGGVRRDETQQPTVSGPGWSTILTGVWTNRHGVTDNDFAGRDFQSNPTFLEFVEESVPNVVSGSFVNWDPIDAYLISSVDDRDSQIDVRRSLGSDSATSTFAARFLQELPASVPAVVFVALDDVDAAGHQCGSSGDCYKSAIRVADIYVGRMLKMISSRESFSQEDWQIVLTSDHGHRSDGGHGGHSALERRIPFVASSQRVNPGSIEPNVNGTPVSHADVAPTVLQHFGIALPDYFWGESRANGLAMITPTGDVDGNGLLEVIDIDIVTSQAASHEHSSRYDLNVDGFVDSVDIVLWVRGFANTWVGDVNVDGEFDSSDLVSVFQRAAFEVDVWATWSSGDWNGDGRFNSSDLALAFQDGGFEIGPRTEFRSVPEPASTSALGLLCFGTLGWRRRSPVRSIAVSKVV